MRTRHLIIAVAALSIALATPQLDRARAADIRAGMKSGPVALRSAGPLAFGPEGVLFVADGRAARIFAFDTGDLAKGAGAPPRVEAINDKVAALLGTAADQILLADLAVNPVSGNAYLAVLRGRGPDAVGAVVRVDRTGKLAIVPLETMKHSEIELTDAPAAGESSRGQDARRESITDLAYVGERLLVAGLSNQEFASTLRSFPVPFGQADKGTSLEIYHGAHGKFETRSPVRTFVPFDVGGAPHLLAAYTCTPLVVFPVAALAPGAQLKGRTIAELGNRNRPLDMIAYRKGGKDFLLIANSSRGLMKVSTENMANAEAISSPVKDGSASGQPYETIADGKGIDQLDSFDAEVALVVRQADGKVNLEALPLP